jgi:hypothetical protein
MNLRRALAASSLSVLAVLGTVAPASAADPACDDAVALQTSVDGARTALTAAEAAFHAANRPLGLLVAAKRHEAKAELAQSRAALKSLSAQLHGRRTTDVRQSVLLQLRTERRDVVEARSLLTFKRAALAEIKADRTAARAALTSARTALADLETTQESCGSTSTDD